MPPRHPLPEHGPGNHRCQLVFEHAPTATRCQHAPDLVAPSCPPTDAACAAPASTHRAISMEPHLCQGTVRFRPQRVHIEHALPAFYRDFHLPATPVHSHYRWAESIAGASVVKTNTQPANQRLSAVGVPFLWPCRHFCRHDWLAPRSSDRHAPNPAPHAGRLSRRVLPPGYAAFPCAVVSRRRLAPKALPPRHAGPH